MKYFSSLIIIEKCYNHYEDDNYEVRLVHFSVKEYLTSHRIGEGSFSAFSFTDVNAHIHIALSCLAYLLHLNAKFERSFEESPFWLTYTYHLVDYVALYWGTHLEDVSRALWPAKVASSVVLALADHSLSLSLILQNRDTKSETFHRDILKKPHCYTAYRGFRQLTEVMIAQKHGANKYITQEDLYFGLYFAAYGGHLDIVQIFFEKGANMNAHCGNRKSAVHAAVSGGHINILEFFLNNGADFNSQSSLRAGLSIGETKCLEYLLDHGMNIDLQDENCETALHKAIADEDYYSMGLTGDEKNYLIDILLERGADVNALSDKLGTPLQAACVELYHLDGSDRRLLLIEKLFNYGADPNICGGTYATALQAACYTGYGDNTELAMKVVQLLIDHGADVNIQGGEWGSALHAAAASLRHGEAAVERMKLLLASGAKVDQDSWGTALQLACREGTVEAARFLLDRGGDVNAEGGRFGTPLLAAAARKDYPGTPRLSFLTLLISKGANVNQQGGEDGSALQGVFHSHPKVESARFLLEHGADVNVKGGKHGTVLIAACESRTWDEECIRLLLDHDADVNAHSEEYGTALIVACQLHYYGWFQDTKVVQLLLDRGAEVNEQGGKHGTALAAACSWGHSEAVKLLLNHGAKIHLRDCAAWHTAARYLANSEGDDYRVDARNLELLLNRGMDVNHVHGEHGTALHAMMTSREAGPNWRSGIDFLLKRGINPNIINEHLGSALHLACTIKREHDEEHSDVAYEDSVCNIVNCSSRKTKYLLEQCPSIHVNAQGGIFGSVLQAAAYSGQTLSVRLLLEREARVNMRGGKYQSALNGAIISGYWDIVKILLEAGATPDYNLQEQPDEEWLQTVLEEDGRGAVERYRKFWEVESVVKEEGGMGFN